MLFVYWCIILILAGVVSDVSTCIEQGEAFLCLYIGIFCIGTLICFITKRKSIFCKDNLLGTFLIVIQSFLLYKAFILTNMPPVSFYFLCELFTFVLGLMELSDTFKP